MHGTDLGNALLLIGIVVLVLVVNRMHVARVWASVSALWKRAWKFRRAKYVYVVALLVRDHDRNAQALQVPDSERLLFGIDSRIVGTMIKIDSGNICPHILADEIASVVSDDGITSVVIMSIFPLSRKSAELNAYYMQQRQGTAHVLPPTP